jgi:hypothetical protein
LNPDNIVHTSIKKHDELLHSQQGIRQPHEQIFSSVILEVSDTGKTSALFANHQHYEKS